MAEPLQTNARALQLLMLIGDAAGTATGIPDAAFADLRSLIEAGDIAAQRSDAMTRDSIEIHRRMLAAYERFRADVQAVQPVLASTARAMRRQRPRKAKR